MTGMTTRGMTPRSKERTTETGRWHLLVGLAGVMGPALLHPAEALAQRTTATIRVSISAGGGSPPGGVVVSAMNTDTGVTTHAIARADGSHLLTGLPPGEYLVTAIPPDGKEAYRVVQVNIGQDLSLDVDIGQTPERSGQPQTGQGETIIVQGNVSESTTSELATNISRDQIDNLPQNNRNFLNFAALAPGVRLNQDEFRQEMISGAVGASQTNIFVDGVSLKSHILQGGTVGQDSSRGNPFPQLAVGGFRVITQNYKAEYEQAGSAIISAITRSGGNEYHGELFTSFQNENLTAIDYFVERNMNAEPDLTRYQIGAAASGPVIEDKLFVFLTYEGNYQNRQNLVLAGGQAPAGAAGRFDQFEGVFTSPFREHLGFGKFTWHPAPSQSVDVSGSLRTETDVRSFGDTTAFENAENVRNRVFTASARHQWWVGSILNEGTFQFLANAFNPMAENSDMVGQEFLSGGDGSATVMRIGGRDTNQKIGQRGFTLRDDITFSDIEGLGQHVIKTGAKVSFEHYGVTKRIHGNPLFRYYNLPVADDPSTPDFDESILSHDYSFPAEGRYGVGDPSIDTDNTQFGIYVQDDWQIGKRLTLNLGVRWDVETNPINNGFVTPARVRSALTDPQAALGNRSVADVIAEANDPDFFPVDDYLTDGNDRPIYLGEIQPRIGLAFDVTGDHNTVLFGGAGRYYDRTLFNSAADEQYHLQYEERKFLFGPPGTPRTMLPDGQLIVPWMDQYLSTTGLDQAIADGNAPEPEVYLMKNDLKPLRTDQFSAGVRQQVGPMNATLSVTHIRSENGLGFYPANRFATGTRDYVDVPGFADVLIAADDRQSRYTSVQLGLEKPLDYAWSVRGIPWGASLAYTLAWAKDRGVDFNFDYPTIEDSPLEPTEFDERQRLVMSGIVGLPLDFKASTLITLGTGIPFNLYDSSSGVFVFRRNEGRAARFLEFRQVDLRLAKNFGVFEGNRVDAYIECFNVFNSKNFGGYNGTIGPPGAPNPDYGVPSKLVATPRALQLGMAYHF